MNVLQWFAALIIIMMVIVAVMKLNPIIAIFMFMSIILLMFIDMFTDNVGGRIKWNLSLL